MRLFLDTEFNGFCGKLISMALVPENDSIREFYIELEMTDQLDPWVRDNVIPHLILQPSSFRVFQNELAQYLHEVNFHNDECIIVADWPDDIRHLCESLITGPGEMIPIKHTLKFELDLNIKYNSLVPHNALFDARAIKEFYLKNVK